MMKARVCIVFIAYLASIACKDYESDSEYSDYNNDDYHVENVTLVSNNASQSGLINQTDVETITELDEFDDDGEYDTYSEPSCSIDYFINNLSPNDYQEGQSMPITRQVAHINETIRRLNRLTNYVSEAFTRVEPFVKQVMARSSDVLFTAELSDDCFNSILRILSAIQSGQTWAMKFIDSMGSFIPSGSYEGVVSSFGEFDECLDIRSADEDKGQPFRGKYCLLKPIIPLPSVGSLRPGESMPNISIPWLQSMLQDRYVDPLIEMMEFQNRTIYRIGLCIPSVCHRLDIENAINKAVFPITQIPFEVGPDCIVSESPIILNRHQLTALTVCVVLLLITAISTAIDIYQRNSCSNSFAPNHVICEKKVHKLLTSFSIVRNTSYLFRLDSNRLLSVDTIRLFTIAWIFVMNSYILTALVGMPALKRLATDGGPYKLLSDRKYFFVRNPFMVDTLIFISGLSLAIRPIRLDRFNYVWFLVRRWIRLTAPLIGSILFIYVCPLLGDGPLWQLSVQIIVRPCHDNLWPTIFYYSNFFGDVENTCNTPSSYLSAAFQLHIIAPIIFLPIVALKSRRLSIGYGIIWILIGCFLAPASNFIFGVRTPYEIPEMSSFRESKYSIMHYWLGFNQHVSTFSFGVLVGHLARRPIGPKQKCAQLFLWILAPICSALAVHWNEQFSFIELKTTSAHNLVFIAFGKVVWCVGFAWIIYACCTGKGGIVNRFLSHYIFQPLSRLSYSFSLLFTITVLYRVLTVRQTYAMSDWQMSQGVIIDYVLTTIGSYWLYVLVECPVNNLLRLIGEPKPNSFEFQNCHHFADSTNKTDNNNNNKVENHVYRNDGFNDSSLSIDNKTVILVAHR